jgi:hypothetical protein
MPKIKWLNHPTDSTLNNTEQHVSNPVADYAIAVGQASVCTPARRGTNQWLVEMAEQEKLRKPNPLDVCVANVWPPTWECITLPRTNKPCIVYRSGSEVTRFESLYWYETARGKDGVLDPMLKAIQHDLIPESCPDSIVKHFKELEAANSPEAIDAANARAFQAKLNAETHAKQTDRTFKQRLGL